MVAIIEDGNNDKGRRLAIDYLKLKAENESLKACFRFIVALSDERRGTLVTQVVPFEANANIVRDSNMIAAHHWYEKPIMVPTTEVYSMVLPDIFGLT